MIGGALLATTRFPWLETAADPSDDDRLLEILAASADEEDGGDEEEEDDEDDDEDDVCLRLRASACVASTAVRATIVASENAPHRSPRGASLCV